MKSESIFKTKELIKFLVVLIIFGTIVYLFAHLASKCFVNLIMIEDSNPIAFEQTLAPFLGAVASTIGAIFFAILIANFIINYAKYGSIW